MTKGRFRIFTIIVFLLTAGIIGTLVFMPGDFFSSSNQEIQRTRVIIPQSMGAGGEALRASRETINDETQPLRIVFEENEAVVAVLTRDFSSHYYEEQVIAYRKLQDIDSPIYITYAGFDEQEKQYSRRWSASTAATKPGTLILYSEDLIGDGGICVLVSGMNGAGEQTLTVFRKIDSRVEPFSKIAEFLIEGSIAVEEPESGRRGRSLSIATYGRDYSSSNIMDQIEITYTFNQINGLYEQSRIVKIPGTQIEQRMVRELLNGEPGQFKNFIDGLWYQGDGAGRKYVCFNTASQELIFYDNNSQEVFIWLNSTPTRYGLHINSQNVSLTKLRRTINVELTSLDSIRLRVYQDAYLRSGPNTVWDGSYQRVQAAETIRESRKALSCLEGRFTGQDGTITFYKDGSFRMDPLSGPSELGRQGHYVFFAVGSDKLLELRTESGTKETRETTGETYKISQAEDALTLTRVQIGTRGIQDLHEAPIVLQLNSSE
ncbi:MAG: pallilysin-related adhesin [Treponema sp.]|nr:pallilysin-related adhesin [Treponema sp.]